MTREHLVIGELIEPQKTDLYLWENGAWYVRDSEVKRLRDEDRRWFRRHVYWALGCVVVVMFCIRVIIDYIASHPAGPLKPLIGYLAYITIASFVLGITLLSGSIYLVFMRRG
jgi:hypothetical protein